MEGGRESGRVGGWEVRERDSMITLIHVHHIICTMRYVHCAIHTHLPLGVLTDDAQLRGSKEEVLQTLHPPLPLLRTLHGQVVLAPCAQHLERKPSRSCISVQYMKHICRGKCDKDGC